MQLKSCRNLTEKVKKVLMSLEKAINAIEKQYHLSVRETIEKSFMNERINLLKNFKHPS